MASRGRGRGAARVAGERSLLAGRDRRHGDLAVGRQVVDREVAARVRGAVEEVRAHEVAGDRAGENFSILEVTDPGSGTELRRRQNNSGDRLAIRAEHPAGDSWLWSEVDPQSLGPLVRGHELTRESLAQ